MLHYRYHVAPIRTEFPRRCISSSHAAIGVNGERQQEHAMRDSSLKALGALTGANAKGADSHGTIFSPDSAVTVLTQWEM